MTTLNTPNTLNLETVYIVTSHLYQDTVVFTESEIPTIGRHLSALGLDEGYIDRVGDRLVDCQGLEFAQIALPEDLVYQANRLLERPNVLTTDGSDNLYAAPGTHDSTLIVGDGTAHIEGNAAEIINALWYMDPFGGIEAAWAALAHFPVTCDCGRCADCDTKPEQTEPEHYEPSEAELEHWQDMCHEQYGE